MELLYFNFVRNFNSLSFACQIGLISLSSELWNKKNLWAEQKANYYEDKIEMLRSNDGVE